jgi:hypothetical protein
MMHPFKTGRNPGESTVPPTVDISTEMLEGRSRRIKATIAVPGSLEQVWQLLTDYDRLSDF